MLNQRHRLGGQGLLAIGLFVLITGSLHDLGMVAGFITPDHWSFVTPAFTAMLSEGA